MEPREDHTPAVPPNMTKSAAKPLVQWKKGTDLDPTGPTVPAGQEIDWSKPFKIISPGELVPDCPLHTVTVFTITDHERGTIQRLAVGLPGEQDGVITTFRWKETAR